MNSAINDELCIKNGELCNKMMNYALKMMNLYYQLLDSGCPSSDPDVQVAAVIENDEILMLYWWILHLK